MSFSAPAAAQIGGGGSDQPASPPGPAEKIFDAIGSTSRYLVAKIQPGERRDLIDNPRFNSQDTPRHTMMTFMEAMSLVDRGYTDIGYGRALASLPAGSDRQDADDLYFAMTRLGLYGAAALPGQEEIGRTGDTRYEFFPRGTDHQWVWEAASSPPTGEIAVTKGEDGFWLFSDATMSSLGGLTSSLADLPPRFLGTERNVYFVRVFAPIVQETSWLELALFVITLAGGIFAAMGVHWAFGKAATKAEDTDRYFLGSTLRGVGRSGALVVFTVLFTVAFGFIELGPVLRGFQYTIPRFLLVVAIGLFVLSLIDMTAAFLRRRIEAEGSGHYDRMVITIIRRTLRVVVAVIIAMFVLQNMLGLNVGALIFSFGIIGLALSLAAQDSVKNLFGAISIFVQRPFVIGDWIEFKGEGGDYTGVIEDIDLQSTKLKVMSGDIVTIPNMLFISREVQNLSARGYIRRELNIAIPYRPDVAELDRAMEALRDVLSSDDVLVDGSAKDRAETPHVSFSHFAASWLNIKCYHYYFMGDQPEAVQRDEERGWLTYLSHCSLVNRKIVEVFGQRDIEFAFPSQTIYFDDTLKTKAIGGRSV